MSRAKFIISLFITASLSLSVLAKSKVATAEQSLFIPDYSAHILTPLAPETPRINSAKVFGVRPGAEILYTIAATGVRPMTFSAEGLPQGVTVDSRTGRICGKIAKEGTYNVVLKAENAKGSYTRELKIVVGDKIQGAQV